MKKIVIFIIAIITCQKIICGNSLGSTKVYDVQPHEGFKDDKTHEKSDKKDSAAPAEGVIPFAFPLSAHPQIIAQIQQQYIKPPIKEQSHIPMAGATSERDILLDKEVPAATEIQSHILPEPTESIKADDKKGTISTLRGQQKRQFAQQQAAKPTPPAPAVVQENPMARKAHLIASAKKRAFRKHDLPSSIGEQ